MLFSLRFGDVFAAVFLLMVVQWFTFSKAELPVCSKSKEGNRTLYRKVTGDDGVVICFKNSGKYVWTFLDGSPTLGEKFDPAKDCSDIVDNVPEAKDGFYWFALGQPGLLKAWCDVHTDGGGFMLIGMKNSPKTWNVPSNDIPVDPMGPPHWSSEFGDIKMQDFAIQISRTSSFKDTKAHWFYRLKTRRDLGNLFGVESGGCTDIHSGIGNISYVKDILTETVVTTKFHCSKFGYNIDVGLGWGRMNYCLRNKCPKGYAYLPGVPIKLDSFGSFSYSVSSELSGITDNATVFFGCDNGQCCACFGPKGGRDHYCSKKCTAINGGTVLKSQVYAWFWIRTRMPRRVWKRCMEFKMKTKAGKIETYFIDRDTGTSRKGSCSKQFQTFLNEGTLLVKNKESLDNFPPVPGIFSYRKDNKKVYVSKGDTWEAIGSEKETKNLTLRVQSLEDLLKTRIEKIEKRLNASLFGSKVSPGKSCKNILTENKFAGSGIYWIQPATNKLFQVYCDMETHGGGWTLVYSYTFTNYNNFNSDSNAVTPRPNWPTPTANVPISTTPPLSESSLGAVDYSLWKEIGKEFMIKSNINDWLVCKPNAGSMVTKTHGSISCLNIKNVATSCQGLVPDKVYWNSRGPALYDSSIYYYFDGDTRGYWPVHDPCCKTQPNQKKGVSNPGGQIYLC